MVQNFYLQNFLMPMRTELKIEACTQKLEDNNPGIARYSTIHWVYY